MGLVEKIENFATFETEGRRETCATVEVESGVGKTVAVGTEEVGRGHANSGV
jgi:hypothetical protein